MTDRGLIEQYVRHGSDAAFSELVERHKRLVFATCQRDLGDAMLAEDCTQAVFLILARKAKWLRGYHSLAGWLFKTARLAARDAVKQEIRRRKREAAIMEQLNTQAEREAAAWRTVEPELNDALDSMPSTDREVLLMRFFDQSSHADIAATMGIKEDTARIRVSRAVERLRVRLLSRLGAGAGIVAGIALADLLTSRAAGAAVPDIAAKPILIGRSSSSLAAGHAAPAHGIAQGALKAMSRMTAMKLTAGAAFVAGIAILASSPIVAHAHLLGPGRLLMYVPSNPPAGGATVLSATAPAPVPLSVGYTETYRFQADGKDIGTETATLTALTSAEETWSFNSAITVEANGQPQNITEDGTAAFASSGHPDLVNLNADVAGAKQVVSIDFTKLPVSLNATVNGLAMTIAAPYKPAQFLTLSNNLSFSSVTLRHLPRPDGKDLVIPYFSVDGPLSGTATWNAVGREPITSEGKSVTCSIYQMAGITTDQPVSQAAQAALNSGVGTRMWVDPSGSILKLVKPTGNIVVTRE